MQACSAIVSQRVRRGVEAKSPLSRPFRPLASSLLAERSQARHHRRHGLGVLLVREDGAGERGSHARAHLPRLFPPPVSPMFMVGCEWAQDVERNNPSHAELDFSNTPLGDKKLQKLSESIHRNTCVSFARATMSAASSPQTRPPAAQHTQGLESGQHQHQRRRDPLPGRCAGQRLRPHRCEHHRPRQQPGAGGLLFALLGKALCCPIHRSRRPRAVLGLASRLDPMVGNTWPTPCVPALPCKPSS
jgi:hypothetical protein